MNKDIKKVMLISGGISAEREISIISGKEVAKSLDRLGHKIIHVDANLNLLEKIEEIKPDVIFNALHGTWGEDGQVQKILELSKTAYTHSGVKASKIAMDKHESAKIFIKNDIIYFMSFRFIGGGGTPYAIQNILPVLFNMPLKNYIIATFVGSMPSMFVTVSLGSGIESIIDKNEELSILSVISSPEIYLPIIGFFAILGMAYLIKKFYFKG